MSMLASARCQAYWVAAGKSEVEEMHHTSNSFVVCTRLDF